MGRLSASILTLALGAVAALGLLACGSGSSAELLPGETASEITENLDKVKELANEHECVGAEVAAQKVSGQVEALGGIDAELKQALRAGANRLNEVVASCEETAIEETAPAIEPNEEPEEAGKEKKPKPEKSQPAKEPKVTPEEAPTPPTLPPQANGEAKGHEKGSEEAPPAEAGGGSEPPSGGVGPAAPVEGD